MYLYKTILCCEEGYFTYVFVFPNVTEIFKISDSYDLVCIMKMQLFYGSVIYVMKKKTVSLIHLFR